MNNLGGELMANLDQRRINFVKNLSINVRARVLYEFLKKGTSTRNIEKLLNELEEEDGWQAWSVVHFYGFNGKNKAKYNLTLKSVKEAISDLNVNELEELHLNISQDMEGSSQTNFTESDGQDVFRKIKTRQGQYKLRKALLHNYQSKCAMCNISNPKLLITSHIKTWKHSTPDERMNPSNSILLCNLHDGLFEYGFISLSDDYNILYSPTFDFEGQGISTAITFRKPIIDAPLAKFLEEHRMKYGY